MSFFCVTYFNNLIYMTSVEYTKVNSNFIYLSIITMIDHSNSYN